MSVKCSHKHYYENDSSSDSESLSITESSSDSESNSNKSSSDINNHKNNLECIKINKGCRGHMGHIGRRGRRGPVGPQGIPGLVGPVGPIGPQGISGLVGPVGPQGISGLVGPIGPVGPQGISGLVGPIGPQGISGLVGPIGPIGPQGISGLVGPIGPAFSYADFYALMPGDNLATIAIGGDVQFPNDGPFLGTDIIRTGPSSFELVSIGTYQILFQVSIDEPGQLVISLNELEQVYTTVGRATGTSQLVGVCLIQTIIVNSIITIRNPSGNSTALTITPNAGGTNSVSAHLVIIRMN